MGRMAEKSGAEQAREIIRAMTIRALMGLREAESADDAGIVPTQETLIDDIKWRYVPMACVLTPVEKK